MCASFLYKGSGKEISELETFELKEWTPPVFVRSTLPAEQ